MTQELKAQEKVELGAEGAAETTFSEPVFTPLTDIWETETGLTLVADMPGVSAENLTIGLEDRVLTISGRVEKRPATCTCKALSTEYGEGDYYRQFQLSELIDQEKISATLKNGVLTLELPKVAPAQPRKITVQAV